VWLAVLTYTTYRPLNPLGIFLAFSVYSVLFILCGGVLSLMFRRNRPAQMAYTLLSVGAVVLLSPAANANTILIRFSPSYIFTRLALGAGLMEFWWQLAILASLSVVAYALLWAKTRAFAPYQ
jgi:hypothetical protein